MITSRHNHIELVAPQRGGESRSEPAVVGRAKITALPSYVEGFNMGKEAGLVAGHHAGYEAGVLQGQAQAASQAEVEDAARAEADTIERASRSARSESILTLLGSHIDAALDAAVAQARIDAEELVRLAVELARGLLGRELRGVASEAEAEARLSAGLDLVADNTRVVARLHPADLTLLNLSRPGLELVADPSVEPGGCILQTGATTLDSQLRVALTRLETVLDELYRTEGP